MNKNQSCYSFGTVGEMPHYSLKSCTPIGAEGCLQCSRVRPNPHRTHDATQSKWDLLMWMGVFTLHASNIKGFALEFAPVRPVWLGPQLNRRLQNMCMCVCSLVLSLPREGNKKPGWSDLEYILRYREDPKKNVLQWGVTRSNSPKCCPNVKNCSVVP